VNTLRKGDDDDDDDGNNNDNGDNAPRDGCQIPLIMERECYGHSRRSRLTSALSCRLSVSVSNGD
jgi:hypothetical protein